ncbi:hypothetical protein [Streptomyces sp. NPDC018000]|uniref:hypothetical protein n=1 Tax=Streptomyces sp. NPDC018000 TaxID=3365028 RepID=UPI00379B69A4
MPSAGSLYCGMCTGRPRMHVTVLTDGSITFTGPTRDFLAHAPAGTPEARRAEVSYTTVADHSAALG